jgi:hypothetical protein
MDFFYKCHNFHILQEYEADLKTVDNIDFYNEFSLYELTKYHFKIQECHPIIDISVHGDKTTAIITLYVQMN